MYDYIKTIIPEERILFHEPMSKHTTFRVGGEADCLIMIHEEQELTKLVRYLNQIEEAYFIVGNGSNLLVGDKGYRGVVLKLDGPMSTGDERNGDTGRRRSAALEGGGAGKGARPVRDGVCGRYSRQYRRRRGDECRRLWRRDEAGCRVCAGIG